MEAALGKKGNIVLGENFQIQEISSDPGNCQKLGYFAQEQSAQVEYRGSRLHQGVMGRIFSLVVATLPGSPKNNHGATPTFCIPTI
jgi:hypothetical protein